MYKTTYRDFKNWNEEENGEAIIKLEDEYGGQSVIAKDDGCFVLYNGSDEREFKLSYHWYKEAAEALVYIMYTGRY